MKLLSLLAIGLLSAGAPSVQTERAGTVEIYAYIDAEELTVGGEYAFVIGVSLPGGSTASESGSPAPFLQLDIPASIELTETHLTTYDELAANEFLQEPFERLLDIEEVSIPFKLVADPKPGESIGLNVLAYIRPGKIEDEYFLRRRLELPVTAGAEAVEGDATNSKWGVDKALLQIGDTAPSFALPDAYGNIVALDEFLGSQNIVVSTYRAHW